MTAKIRLKGVWAGFGVENSGDVGPFGKQQVSGRLYHLGSPVPTNPDWLEFTLDDGTKAGLGLGGSGGGVLVLARGYDFPSDMDGSVLGGWDFDFAFHWRIGKYLKGLGKIDKVIDTVEEYKTLRKGIEQGIKNREILTEPGLFNFPIPAAGWGMHIWIGYKFGFLNVLRQGNGVS